MRNVRINQAESIFEPFWDGGDSYPENKKYSGLKRYILEYGQNVGAEIKQVWCGVDIKIWKQPLGEMVAMERECHLSIEGYDTIRIFGAFPKEVEFKIICVIDGEKQTVLKAVGNDTTGEYDGHISGEEITHIRMEFIHNGKQPSLSTLYWLGCSNKEEQMKMENQKSPYDEKWEGCFKDVFEIKPTINIYFDNVELEEIRKKIMVHPFNDIMNKMREQATSDLKINPEAQIGEFVANGDRRWVRDRDMKRTVLSVPMQRLAFVGVVDQNIEMLKMACRMALSLAHHTYWCESIMGVFPGATWHHRSFTEEIISKACSVVLDWAGSLLTWHGRNIINDAIIQKGLPRMEADFKTIEYIRDMNQGIVFSSGRIIALVALAKQYPRYEEWLKSAEIDLFEMIKKYILPDGGTMEGPGYWNYTFASTLPILYVLAKHNGVPLSEYVPKCVLATGEYALAMLSTADDGTKYLPINDARFQRFLSIIPAIYAQISENPVWGNLYSAIMQDFSGDVEKEFIVIAKEAKESTGELLKTGFNHLPNIGQTYMVNDVGGIGKVHIQLLSGPNYFGHCHSDKGSFILEAGSKQIIIDRGVCTYSIPYVSLIGKADNHNIFMPQSENSELYEQNPFAKGAYVTFAACDNGILTYTSDNLNAWDEGIFTKNYRRVFSPHPCVYIINDHVEYTKPLASAFIINTKYDVSGYEILSDVPCKVLPFGWEPEKVTVGQYGYDERLENVNQLKIYTYKAMSHNVLTAIVLGDNPDILGEIEAQTTQYGVEIYYKDKKYTARHDEWIF